jgi:hypothetical protein
VKEPENPEDGEELEAPTQPNEDECEKVERSSGTERNLPSQGAPDAFAPANPTDNRQLYEYRSRWPDYARTAQRWEGIYLGVLAVSGVSGLFALLTWTNAAASPDITTSMALAFCAGLLGGTTFGLKWWYHAIARGIWHLDRRAWRFAVPWQSAIVAMFVHVLFKSDLLGFLNPAALDKIHNVIAFGFLVGYFSDAAIAKLAEIAESLFGAARGGRDKHGP